MHLQMSSANARVRNIKLVSPHESWQYNVQLNYSIQICNARLSTLSFVKENSGVKPSKR